MSFDLLTESIDPADADLVYRKYPDLAKGICPTCKGEGFFTSCDTRLTCNCHYQIQLAKHYAAAGIGRTYQRLDWNDYKGDPKALAEVRHYLENYEAYVDRGVGLLLRGPVGTGKTLLGNLGLKHLVRCGLRCFATTFANTIEAFTSTWGDVEQKAWFADKFMYSDVLFLDDLGKEMRSRNNLPQSTFDSILRTRVQDSRPTILTTNLGLRDMGFGYGSAVLSLLQEQSILIEVGGEDFRRQAVGRTLNEVEIGATRRIS